MHYTQLRKGQKLNKSEELFSSPYLLCILHKNNDRAGCRGGKIRLNCRGKFALGGCLFKFYSIGLRGPVVKCLYPYFNKENCDTFITSDINILKITVFLYFSTN